ncbi:MAG: site-specific integrase [Euzebya sp.]
MVEVMLGTSARIAGTIISVAGQPTTRQDHPKTSQSRRTVALPSFAAEAIRQRLTRLASRSPDTSLFSSRNGTPLTTNNVRRQLRKAMKLTGIEGVTPHMLRRSVATAINREASVDLAPELLGHSDTKVTIQHYIRRNEMVNPITATLLDQVFAPDAGGQP